MLPENIFSYTTENARESFSLYAAKISTPLGDMLGISDETSLYLLEFMESRHLERKVETLREKKGPILMKESNPLKSIQKELDEYFSGSLSHFQTPFILLGSPFQKKVWEKLLLIPLSQTSTYTNIACSLGKPKAVRAVANANGANQLAIIIPCHRVIYKNGKLGGYAGGIARKEQLLHFEQKIK